VGLRGQFEGWVGDLEKVGRGNIPVGRVTWEISQRDFVWESCEVRLVRRAARGKMSASESRRSIVRVGAARSVLGARAMMRLRGEMRSILLGE